MAFAKNTVTHHNPSKHIEIWYHFVRDCVTKGKLSLEKVSTTDNVANVTTKSITMDRFQSLRKQMGVEMILDQS